jgi:hypothetical protein
MRYEVRGRSGFLTPIISISGGYLDEFISVFYDIFELGQAGCT